MSTTYFTTGTAGSIALVDNTDDPDLRTVDVFLRCDPPMHVPSLPWAYRVDSSEPHWRSYNFLDLFSWQKLSSIYLTKTVEEFTFVLGNTNTVELGGPEEFTIAVNRSGSVNDSVLIRVDGVHRRATPYIRTDGVWVVAEPFVKTPLGWVRSS